MTSQTSSRFLDQLQSVRTLSLPNQIYEQLRAAILTGELAPGVRMLELDIAAKMGTSQGPVREALQKLENDGLVEKRPRSGTVVSQFSVDEIQEMFEIRSLVEKFMIHRTARSIQPAQCEELQGLVEEMRVAAEREDMLTLAALDMEFHRRICEWSGSKSLMRVWMPLYSQIQRYVTQHHRRHFPNLKEIADLHQPVVDALRRGDAEESGRVIEEHILLVFRRLK